MMLSKLKLIQIKFIHQFYVLLFYSLYLPVFCRFLQSIIYLLEEQFADMGYAIHERLHDIISHNKNSNSLWMFVLRSGFRWQGNEASGGFIYLECCCVVFVQFFLSFIALNWHLQKLLYWLKMFWLIFSSAKCCTRSCLNFHQNLCQLKNSNKI